MPNVVPHIGPGVQAHLSLMPSDQLPQTVVADIFAKTETESIMMTMGQRIQVGINETVIRTPGKFPEAGQVGGTTLASREGELKPVAGIQYGGQRSFSPIKLAVIVTASAEYVKTDPLAMWRELSTKLPRAIARAADLAVVHGRDALRGSALVGIENNGYLNKTTNRIELDLKPGARSVASTGVVTNPDIVDQILSGVALVDNDATDWEFSNFAAVPSLGVDLMRVRDTGGFPVFTPGAATASNAGAAGTQISARASVGSLLGIPVTFNKMVRGKVGAFAGTNVKMIGGDFSQIAWGFADQITVKYTDSASLDDGAGGVINLWQTNQVAILAECTFGWYVNDTNAFVAYDNAVSDTA